jgi:hypothetical protein
MPRNAIGLLPMNAGYPFVIRQAADHTFIEYVGLLIARNIRRFRPNSYDPVRRKSWRLREDTDPVVTAKKMELIEKFEITEWIADPNFNDLIGYITEGGFVHAHTDPASEQRMHIRINLLVCKPEAGCIPMLDGIPVDMDLGDAWLCFASHCRHATTPVVGSKPRSIVSYGLQVHQRAALALFSKYMIWRAAHRDSVGSAAHG